MDQEERAPYEIAAHAYCSTRSGNQRVCPVIVLEHGEVGGKKAKIQGYLFWPCEAYPKGVVNEPYEVFEEHLYDPDALWFGGEARNGKRLIAMARDDETIRALSDINAVAEACDFPPLLREVIAS